MPKTIPFEFVLDLLEKIAPTTKPMFGCIAIYDEDRILLVLRRKESDLKDNGVWIATTREHHASLKDEFPSMRSISLFGPGTSSWQNLPEEAEDFEESVTRACELILKGDPRIGKIPSKKRVRRPRTKN